MESTNLVFHLQRMLKLLLEEQASPPTSPSRGSALHLRPCLEFLLHEGVLDILVTLAQADSPPGIRPFIFSVFIFLLETLRYPLLPESSCHLPLRRLVLVCSLTKASPTESQEIKFLTMLTAKVKQLPDLVHIFLDSSCSSAAVPCSFDTSRQPSGHSSRSGVEEKMHNIERLAINVRAALDCLRSRHALAAALTNYLDSPDLVVALQAMEALLAVAGLESDLAAGALLEGSPLLTTLQERLNCLVVALPGDIEAARLEEVEVAWGQVQEQEVGSFPGRQEVANLLAFLDYLDCLARVAHPLVAAGVGEVVRETLLETVLQPKLETDKEEELLLGLALTAQVWLHIKSDTLALVFSCWLLGPLPPAPPSLLLSSLLNLASSPSATAMEVIRLFDVLLSTPCPYILDRWP